jgi:phosphohistidine phosphatase
MLIHLMQHGTCLPKELDPNQPLSPVGREQVEKSAKAARILGLFFELVIASPKARSLQTAEIMSEYTGYPISHIEITEAVKAMAPPATTLDFIQEYDGLDSILIVGHLPSLTNLASQITIQDSGLEIDIHNSGLMQLEVTSPKKKGKLNWHLTPIQLAEIARN